MNDHIDRIREHTVQLRDAQRARRDVAMAAARERAASRAGTHLAGSRVFDTVSGLEGEVVGTARENVIVPTAEQ